MPDNSSLLARAALRRIAELKLLPTPETFRRFYEEAAGRIAPAAGAVPDYLDRVSGAIGQAESATRQLAQALDDEVVRVRHTHRQLDAADVDAGQALRALGQVTSQIRSSVEASSGELGRIRDEVSALRRDVSHARLLAEQDALTRIGNRRALDRVLGREIARSRAGGEPLSVLLVDLDRFKQINDTHGHKGGDQVLVEFARFARSTLQGTDFVARFGGEEFILVLPRTDLRHARQAGERLLALCDASSVTVDGVAVVVSFSAGVAQWQPAEEAAALIARADRALYAAKAGGRHRVVEDAGVPAC